MFYEDFFVSKFFSLDSILFALFAFVTLFQGRLNNDVLPFFEEHNVKVQTVLTDNGREYCGREDQHPFELFLQLEDIEHRTTKVRRPRSNGYVERLHRTLLDEHFRIAGRSKFYESIDEMQIDLEIFFEDTITDELIKEET
ncbi:integrase core domain protein [Leptospira kirschneri str. 200803703]|uniref:Integrase core domain protein n=1 Tax=Leptospira kirschneri str. 200802841 TaxID=1193047 RepID=A0A828Y3C0_9LEPT|nr:integrase core domain protein [Leptospira kirschneri str. 200802841]EMO68244.1 integrase core domain protein [Leptospira kirschneri str. 200803703]EMO74167.1 integrase core domain protein [Leptospira kirschneri str. 200801925]